MRQAVLLLILGVPLFLVSAMAPGFFARVEDERSWRARRDAVEYLEAWPSGWRRPEAMAAIEAEQRKQGFVSQLRASGGPVQAHSAAFTADGAEAITADGMLVSRWSLRTGALVAQYGEKNRRLAKDPLKLGHGFSAAALLEGGLHILALTNGPHSLQVFGEPAVAPVVLPGDGYEGLATHGSQAAVVHSVQDRDEVALVDTATWRTTALPHPEVAILRFAPGGELLTVSRREGRWWREGRLQRTVPMPGTAEPLGISTDAQLVFIADGSSVTAWNIDRGELVFRAPMEGEPLSVCSSGGTVFTGTDRGQVFAHAAATGYLAGSFRAHVTAVNRVYCGPAHLISAANNGNDVRLWRVNGPAARPSAPAVAERAAGWLVEQGLRLDVPGLSEFARGNENELQVGGVAGVGAMCLLAWRMARRRPTTG